MRYNVTMFEELWDKIWRDKNGKIVIWQWPNVWLYAWAGLAMVSLFLNKGLLSDVFSWASHVALIVWALLEIFKGVNYFRRGLGAVVLIFAILSLLHNL